MTHILNTRNAILALAVSAVSGIAMSSFAGTANAALLDQCLKGPKGKVISCCNNYVRQHGMPFWMSEANSTCATTVVCYKLNVKDPFCQLQSITPDNPGRTPPGDTPPPPKSTPSTDIPR